MKHKPITSRRFAIASALVLALAGAGWAQAETLTIGLASNINTLDPHMTATVPSELSVLSHIYPALVLRGPDMKLHPSLAQSWEAVDDLTWRFNLTPGATFDNGEPIDAAAVKWNIHRVQDPKVNARIASWFKDISEVTAVDPITVEIRTAKPYPALADQLSMFFLLPPAWTGTHNPAAEAASGGAYRLLENVPGDRVTLEANPKYWGAAPAFDRVEFRSIPESASRVAALEAGEVDWISGIPTSEIAGINGRGAAHAAAHPTTRSMMVAFNQEKAPLDNKLVREALNYAIDKEGIAKAIFGGHAAVSRCQILTPDYFGYNPDLKPIGYDPAKARELLAQSGVDLSKPIELEVPLGRYMQAPEVGQIIAAMLTSVGLKVKITEMDFGAFITKRTNAHDMAQMALLGLAWPTLDVDGMLTMYTPGNIYDYWGNEPFGDLIAKARSTTDREERQAIYREATSLMCSEAATLFLYQEPLVYAISKKVNWQARGDDWVRAMDMVPAKAQ
ncbi:ABC transporter substrate-binding protein [Brucella anthropi]|uniref:ABC transporter substrate-binding protein n=1 Tax=Brucella anthropi TaxID=529 RepID=UPI000DEC3B21|nr:ABC transporter substrate-binding protein [Brucella anthropi]RCI77215.1 ABC transporter substrate-binding protein [Brucella anthropi]